MLGLHVVFAVDRAGLVGEDGETHHGVFDVGFLRQAPGLCLLAPASRAELSAMLQWAVEEYQGPVAIRYPRGADREYTDSCWTNDPLQSAVVHQNGRDLTIITYGSTLENAICAAKLAEDEGISVSVIRLMNLSQLPIEKLTQLLGSVKNVIVVEEVAANSGIGKELAYELSLHGVSAVTMDLGEHYVPHGSLNQLYRHCGLDAESICSKIKEVLGHEN